jgi:hypothetical protein
MTGQVKEEIITRFGELGVRVRDGLVGFEPALLRRDEFLAAPARYHYVDLSGAQRSLDVPAGGLAFTFCQVPVVYTLTPGEALVRVVTHGDSVTELAGGRLESDHSQALLARLGGIARIEVDVPERELYRG